MHEGLQIGICSSPFRRRLLTIGRWTKKALSTHHNVSHLHKRDPVRTRRGCSGLYVYKYHLLRHVAQAYKQEVVRLLRGRERESRPVRYRQNYQETLSREEHQDQEGLRCPYPHPPPAFMFGPDLVLFVLISVFPADMFLREL